MTFVHRNAVRDDLPAIVAIYNEAVPLRIATVERKPVSVASRLRWFGAHDPTVRPLWVVEQHRQVVAWLSYGAMAGRANGGATAELSVYISAGLRRRGVGSYLIRTAVDRAPSLGVSTLSALVLERNAPSLALFQKYGFERRARLPRVARVDDAPQDLVMLGRAV